MLGSKMQVKYAEKVSDVASILKQNYDVLFIALFIIFSFTVHGTFYEQYFFNFVQTGT